MAVFPDLSESHKEREANPMKIPLRFILTVLPLVAGETGFCQDTGANDRIRPYPKNLYYFQYKGKPTLLLGGTVEDNLFQIPNLTEELDRLRSAGGNYVRNTMSCRDVGNIWPFAKRGDLYDLNRWNDGFWERFENFLAETARRDVIVQIEIWATFDYYRDNWEVNPFNPKNNVNYTAGESRLPERVDSHPVRTGNPFFRSVPGAENLPVVLKSQERFVEKILSHSLRYDHVLYCMDNETSVTPLWGAHWAAFIKRKAKEAGKEVETTEMWDPWDIFNKMHSATVDHPELYSFVDISQNNHQKGQRHYDNALKRRESIRAHPRPLTSVKIYGADGERFGDSRDGIERFWRNIFCGLAGARFHRPASGIGLSERAQRMVRSAREVTGAIDIFTTEPRNDLLEGREENEAYCLGNPGTEYAVYFPQPGEVLLNTKDASGELTVRWYEIDKGRWLPQESRKGGGKLPLKAPGPGQWAVVIQGKDPKKQARVDSTEFPEELTPFFRPPPKFRDDFGKYRSPLKFSDGRSVKTREDWMERRQEILKTWHEILHPWPPVLEKPTVEYLEKLRRENLTQHRVKVEIAPDHRTFPGYLLVPDGEGPFPAVVVVFYDAETGAGLGKELRDFGFQLAKRGFVALSTGTGASLYYPSKENAQLQPLSALAYAAANCYQALANLPEVDPKRVGIVGHSYGGKWAMFASCLFEKFACAAWSDGGIVFDEKRPNVNYWEPWYLGYEQGKTRRPGIPTKENPRTGAYRRLIEEGHDLHELHALMAPRPFLVSGGSEDRPGRWRPLNHAIQVNRLLGYENRVALTNRPGHSPTAESNEQLYRFFEHFLTDSSPVDSRRPESHPR